MITNVRHVKALKDAFQSMSMVKSSIENGMPEDFYSIDLMDAYEKLGPVSYTHLLKNPKGQPESFPQVKTAKNSPHVIHKFSTGFPRKNPQTTAG